MASYFMVVTWFTVLPLLLLLATPFAYNIPITVYHWIPFYNTLIITDNLALAFITISIIITRNIQ